MKIIKSTVKGLAPVLIFSPTVNAQHFGIASAINYPTAKAGTPLSQINISDSTRFFTTGDGCRIAYQLYGSVDKPVLVLSNSIATNLHMWDEQVQALATHFRILRYDTRGHGASDAPIGPYSIDRMGLDVVELLDFLKIQRVHFCGLSLGGLIGQWLAIHAPERIDRLVLANTSPYLGPAEPWNKLIASLQEHGDMTGFADMFIKNWFSESFINNNKVLVAKFRSMVLNTKPRGLEGSFAAVRDIDMRRTIALIRNPTLIIAGRYDQVTIPAHSEFIAQAIPGATIVILPVVHMTNIELPNDFLKLITDFLPGK